MKVHANGTLVVLAQLAGWLRKRKASHESTDSGAAHAAAQEIGIVLQELERVALAEPESIDASDALGLVGVAPHENGFASYERALMLTLSKAIRGVFDAASCKAAARTVRTADHDAAVLESMLKFCADLEGGEESARDLVRVMFAFAAWEVSK